MSKCVCHFMKGMGLGVIVGCAAGAVGTCCVMKNKKGLKKNAGKALHSIGDFIENVMDMF